MKNTPSLGSREHLTLSLSGLFFNGLLLSGLLLGSMSGAGSAVQAG
jgi:hypothetical protein